MMHSLCEVIIESPILSFFYNNIQSIKSYNHTIDNCLAIPIENLKYVCVYIKIDDQMYIGIPINQTELE